MKKITLLFYILCLVLLYAVCNKPHYDNPFDLNGDPEGKIEVTNSGTLLIGETVNVRFSINLPKLIDSAVILFGDGSKKSMYSADYGQNGTAIATHVYAMPGTDTISATLFVINGITKKLAPVEIFIKGPIPKIEQIVDTNRTVTEGGQISITFNATGTEPLSWLWKHNQDSVSSASKLIISNATMADSGIYFCIVNNEWGADTSQKIHITVCSSQDSIPKIIIQPRSDTVLIGQSTFLFVKATGKPSPTYQWKKNGAEMSGATIDTLKINSVKINDTGSYTVEVANIFDTITSQAAVLTVHYPPIISTEPNPLYVKVGDSACFIVIATANPAPMYQWKKDGAPITNATNADYRIASAQFADSGDYEVTVKNLYDSVTSRKAKLIVSNNNIAPVINSQPESDTVKVGDRASFNVAAAGIPAPRYQWKKNGAIIPGATGSAYTIPTVKLSDTGSYNVVAANIVDSVTSKTAVLVVYYPPAISTQPKSDTILAGQSAIFFVNSTGKPSPTYQWKKNGIEMPGATTDTLKINSVKTTDTGSYTVEVANVIGTKTSQAAVLTVHYPPNIVTEPNPLSVKVGDSACFIVTATANPAPAYQWKKNGAPIQNATNVVYKIASVQLADSGYYNVTVKNLYDSVTSDNAKLTVSNNNIAPEITLHPKSDTVKVGDSACFIVSATGIPAPAYQWKKNSVNITGATSNSYTIKGVTEADSGSYSVTATNILGTANSDPAQLTVKVPPSITKQPVSQSKCIGDSVTFIVTATGSAPLSYQWKRGGANIAGATSASYTLRKISSNDNTAAFSCFVTNGWGNGATSNIATLTVLTPAYILIQPGSQTKWAGESVTFTVYAAGSAPLIYQWKRGSTNIAGATSASYTLPNIGINDSNSTFSCLVTNECGNVTSSAAVLTVRSVKAITAGSDHSLILKDDGTLWACGNNWNGQVGDGGATNTPRIIPVQIMTGVKSVAAGGWHTMIQKADETLWACGANWIGQIGIGDTINRLKPVRIMIGIQKIAAGGHHSLIIRTDNSLWACGANWSGQLGIKTADNISHPTPIQVMTGVQNIAAGIYHSLILMTDKSLWACGNNDSGQLGDGSTICRPTPVQIMTGVQNIAAGGSHSLILNTGGTLWAFGYNRYGQLGDGTTTQRLKPVQIMTDVQNIAASGHHSLILKTNGTLWACGNNVYGQLGDGTTTQRLTPVQIMTGVQNIAAGYYHSLIVKTDGTLWACGRNDCGQLGDGTYTNRLIPVQIKF